MLQAYLNLKEESIIVMILVFKDNKENWHLLKSLGKTGLASITITSHCGEGAGAESISQVPDKLLANICKPCQLVIESLS